MLIRCAVLVLYLIVAKTEVNAGLSKDYVRDVDARYSLWPSIHHAVRLMRIRKREVEAQTMTVKPAEQVSQPVPPAAVPSPQAINIQSEGQSSVQSGAQPAAEVTIQPTLATHTEPPPVSASAPGSPKEDKGKPANSDNKSDIIKTTIKDNSSSVVEDKVKADNLTATEPSKINLSDPGVLKRASIVFGGFALLATAYYFIIYRRKGNTNDAKNTHSSIDPNQFRYGVLQSEDKSSTMELSRVPLTMESDEDDDEDLEIFDLGQKKKSLSYINLEQHDEDIVLNDSKSIDMENLLVDIEDKNPDMINWSGNGSKSIL